MQTGTWRQLRAHAHVHNWASVLTWPRFLQYILFHPWWCPGTGHAASGKEADTITEQDGRYMHEDLVNQPCLETLTGAGTDDQQILPLCGSQACRNCGWLCCKNRKKRNGA
ncbi:hypothetical protein KSB_90280 [Ktedonobacter robiniae]|uniref:Uncharacterized protein n=1 Tax=Ktedonobacter robiniae TaxID=2778365 RepID=A0ABQ3V6H7_9CHLR|nr:hypothetical protein KSB_90280 [Ktedonobacter robiniae]